MTQEDWDKSVLVVRHVRIRHNIPNLHFSGSEAGNCPPTRVQLTDVYVHHDESLPPGMLLIEDCR